LEELWQDLRYGARMLRNAPGFTAIAVLTLALGIGANTAIFSVVDAVLIESVPYKQPTQLVFVWSTMISQGVPISGASAPDFRAWRDRNRVFTDMAAFDSDTFDLAVPGEEPSRLHGEDITPTLFSILGVNPILGRNFLPEEEQWGHHRVALLSYGLWQSRFGGRKDVLSRTIHLDGQDYSIVGVMPQGMPFFDDLPPKDLWVPLAFQPGDDMNTRGNHYLNVVARLKDGATASQAQAEMSGIAGQLEKEFPENKGLGAKVVSLHEQLVGDVRPALLILLGAVAFVLLIACVNVANLMLTRATAREQEFAVRSALGASRKRLLGQLLMESVPIGIFGGAGGVLIAVWGMSLLQSLIPKELPRFNPIGINGRVLIFTATVSLLTAVLFAIAPALHASNANIQDALREGGRSGNDGRGRRRLRSLLVVSEMALALLLLVGAGLLIKTFGALRHTDPGFSVDHVLTMSMPLSPADFPEGHHDQALQFTQELSTRLNALPGVKGSGIATTLPLGFGNGWGKFVDVQGHTPPASLDKVPVVRFQLSTPGYMPAIGARLHEGRYFANQDSQDAPGVAIVNESFVRQFFPNEDPVGKSIRMQPPVDLMPAEFRGPERLARLRTIVGVIADMKDTAVNQPALPTVFAPYAQYKNEGWSSAMVLTVRTTGEPLALAGAVRDRIHSLYPDQPVSDIASMEQLMARSLSQARFSMLLLSIFAGLALLLSAVGIYGVMAYAVTQRKHEIGIRMALGAQQQDVLGMVVGQGAKLAVTGVAIGVIAALFLTRAMVSLLYGVSAYDPWTFTGVAALLVVVALVACYLPARRAARVDPMIALRHE
jgi:putative ABC transport system permease protein